MRPPQPVLIKDRRASPRVPVRMPASLRTLSAEVRAEVVNLSATGALVRLDGALRPGRELEVELRPPGGAPVVLPARVAHATAERAGLAFLTGVPGALEAALELFETVLTQDPQLAIRVRQQPTSLDPEKDRLYRLPLGAAQLSAPEHWVYSLLSPAGTPLADVRRGLG
ncbi:MAG: PilZ domain-containing protein, partial [Myxococcales bacterium]